MAENAPLSLFTGYGIELEYMLVEGDTLRVAPIADKVLERLGDGPCSDVERGAAAWSNEIVKHVIELKCNGPAASIADLEKLFAQEIQAVNTVALDLGAILLPTAMHPFMNPLRETVIWDEENKDIYSSYDRIFGCSGHGWSNLQSMHINMPFSGDEEFGRLHAAVRVVLPMLPALAASSPYYGGSFHGQLDSRLVFYRANQRKIPEIAGPIIPERAFTKADYQRIILDPTYAAIAPHDTLKVLQNEWLNSRGAIARFDRSAIEIRLLDVQESTRADLAIAWLVTTTIQNLVEGHLGKLDRAKLLEPAPLRAMLDRCVDLGHTAVIDDRELLGAFGIQTTSVSAQDFWRHCLQSATSLPLPAGHERLATDAQRIVERGCLASMLLEAAGPNPPHEELVSIYRELHQCLLGNRLFVG